MNVCKKILVTFATLSLSAAAQATPLTYTYTGAPYSFAVSPYTTAEFISGTITVDVPYTPIVAAVIPSFYSFTDGLHTITQSNTLSDPKPSFPTPLFRFAADAQGHITSWDIRLAGVFDVNGTRVRTDILSDKFGDEASMNTCVNTSCDAFTYVASTQNITGGKWSFATAVPAVPEPSTWAMMLAGFCGLALMSCRCKKSSTLV